MEHNQSKHYILLLNRVQQNNMAFYLKVSTQHKHKKFLVKSLSLISFAQIRRSLSLGGESSLVYHLERLHEKKGFADEIKWLREN